MTVWWVLFDCWVVALLGGLLVSVRDDGGELFGGEVEVADCVLLGGCGEGVFDVVAPIH